MDSEFLKWLVGVFVSSGIVSGVGYFFRDVIGHYMTKSVGLRFDKEMEGFKSEIRSNEKELTKVNDFISSVRKERNSTLQGKKVEAAETMMTVRSHLAGFTMAVELARILNVDNLLKNQGDEKVISVLEGAINPLKIDEKIAAYRELDKSLLELYLNENTIQSYRAYESIVFYAVSILKMVCIALPDKQKYLNENDSVEKIIKLIPESKKGFDEKGPRYALYWHAHFYDCLLNELRDDLFGEGNMIKDTESATRLVFDSRMAQQEIRDYFDSKELPEELIRKDT